MNGLVAVGQMRRGSGSVPTWDALTVMQFTKGVWRLDNNGAANVYLPNDSASDDFVATPGAYDLMPCIAIYNPNYANMQVNVSVVINYEFKFDDGVQNSSINVEHTEVVSEAVEDATRPAMIQAYNQAPVSHFLSNAADYLMKHALGVAGNVAVALLK